MGGGQTLINGRERNPTGVCTFASLVAPLAANGRGGRSGRAPSLFQKWGGMPVTAIFLVGLKTVEKLADPRRGRVVFFRLFFTDQLDTALALLACLSLVTRARTKGKKRKKERRRRRMGSVRSYHFLLDVRFDSQIHGKIYRFLENALKK